MKQHYKIWLGTFFGAFLPTVLWLTFNALVLGNCDPKFGCLGGIQLAMLFHGVGGLVSSFIVIGVFLFYKKRFRLTVSKATIISSITIGIVLGLFIPLLFAYNLVIAWLFLAFLLSGIVFYLQRNTSKQLKPPNLLN